MWKQEREGKERSNRRKRAGGEQEEQEQEEDEEDIRQRTGHGLHWSYRMR